MTAAGSRSIPALSSITNSTIPDLTGLFAHLGIATRASQMSFSVSANGGRLEWMGGGVRLAETLNGVFAQRSNLLSVPFLAMLRDMFRFNRQSLADRGSGPARGR